MDIIIGDALEALSDIERMTPEEATKISTIKKIPSTLLTLDDCKFVIDMYKKYKDN